MTPEELERLAKINSNLPKCLSARVFVDKDEARLRIGGHTWVLPKKMLASLRVIADWPKGDEEIGAGLIARDPDMSDYVPPQK